MTDETSPRAALDRILPLLRDKDLDALADRYHDDAVHELPYAPRGAPNRIEGREHIREYFNTTLSRVPLDFHAFEAVEVHDTSDPEVIVAEFDAHGTARASGRAFTTRFVWVLRIRRGQIVHWRDYMNPSQIMSLQADPRLSPFRRETPRRNGSYHPCASYLGRRTLEQIRKRSINRWSVYTTLES